MIYYNANFCKIRLQGNSLQLKATVHQCDITLEEEEIHSYVTKNANFLNFRPAFKAQAVQILEK